MSTKTVLLGITTSIIVFSGIASIEINEPSYSCSKGSTHKDSTGKSFFLCICLQEGGAGSGTQITKPCPADTTVSCGYHYEKGKAIVDCNSK